MVISWQTLKSSIWLMPVLHAYMKFWWVKYMLNYLYPVLISYWSWAECNNLGNWGCIVWCSALEYHQLCAILMFQDTTHNHKWPSCSKVKVQSPTHKTSSWPPPPTSTSQNSYPTPMQPAAPAAAHQSPPAIPIAFPSQQWACRTPDGTAFVWFGLQPCR